MARPFRWSALFLAAAALAAAAIGSCRRGPSVQQDAAKQAFKPGPCFNCHDEVRRLWASGRHKDSMTCAHCHGDLAAHIEEPDEAAPTTRLDAGVCGGCHRDQYDSFNTVNPRKLARREKSLPADRSPNPSWDKLMMGHGFTKEHNAPRSHAFMVVDQYVVDRAYGGRFRPKKGWEYVVAPAPVRVWDVLEDRFPQTNEHRPFLPETAAAANPTCLQCKTDDSILRWKFLGEKDPAAKWDRASNAVEAARAVQNGMACIHCHDPHAAKPRIVRDALLQALGRPEADTLWHKDPRRTKVETVAFRDGFRKIGLLEKYDAKLQCGQCHVEYNCNPGFDTKTGGKVGFDDARTNHFPLKDVFRIYDHYNALGFRDFKHGLTGGLLFKAQHPETEVFWDSCHDQKGVTCGDCHMPKRTNKEGKTYTSHWQASPRNYLDATCLKCHEEWTSEQALYAIDSIQAHIRGKMRKAEFWLSALIDRIVEAKKAGAGEDALRQAQEQHQKAHILWEWWTAENSDGFHNPVQARESLTRSVEEARKGIDLLDKAAPEKRP